MQSPVALGLSLASAGRVSLQCGNGPIDSLPESIVNVGVTENEVIGFSCNITSCAEEEEGNVVHLKHNNATSLYHSVYLNAVYFFCWRYQVIVARRVN